MHAKSKPSPKHPVEYSAVDRFLETIYRIVVLQPLVAGVASGLLIGGLANSGLLFFITTFAIFGLGLHLRARRNA